MASSGVQGIQFAIWVAVLAIAPIVGSIFISVLNLLIDREVPPVLPQINTQSFGQAMVAIVVFTVLGRAYNGGYLLADFLVIVLLFFVLLAQAGIDKRQQDKTQEHVAKVLRSKFGTRDAREHLPMLLDIAKAMIDVDYFPDSI